MDCTLTARNTQITPELRDLIDHRLQPLERVLGEALVSADMVLSSDHRQCVSEFVVHARDDHRLHGVAEGPTWQTAVGGAVDRVMHQAQKLKGKWQARRRHGVTVDVDDTTPDGDASPA
jgi:ribosome-associated translation inhibitor RaiA